MTANHKKSGDWVKIMIRITIPQLILILNDEIINLGKLILFTFFSDLVNLDISGWISLSMT